MSHVKCLLVGEKQLEVMDMLEAMADKVDAFGEPFGPSLHGTQTKLEEVEQNFGVARRLPVEQFAGIVREFRNS
jgi:hypothetical protein